MVHQLAVAQAVLVDQPKEVIDRLIQEAVKEVACHEVGHTLGLRHNFKSSSIYSIDEIKKRRRTGDPLSGSVMDYNPLLFFAEKPTEGTFVTQTLGPWDYCVIEYGYCPADGSYKAQGLEKKEAPPAKQPEVVVAAKPAPAGKAPATEVPRRPPTRPGESSDAAMGWARPELP
jgi:hypothetical protein